MTASNWLAKRLSFVRFAGVLRNMKSKSTVVTGAPWSAAAALPIKTASRRLCASACAIETSKGEAFILASALKQSRRIHVEQQHRMRLFAQPRSGAGGADRPFQGVANGLGFALFGRDAEHFFRGAKRRDRQRESILRHRGQIRKMPFPHLLLPARLIQLHELDQIWIIKLRHGRIIEGQMPILPDAKAAEIDGLRVEQNGVTPALIQ